MNFGDLETAERSAKQVRAVHNRVFGQLSGVPPYPEGSEYTANHQGAVVWVWATLVETSALMFDLLVRELRPEESESFYQDQVQFARFFGIVPSEVPPTWIEFQRYCARMWNSEILTVSPSAQELEKLLFRPQSLFPSLVNHGIRRITFALMPPRLAKGFGFEPNALDREVLYAFFALSSMVYSQLPGSFRYLKAYWEAETRIRGKPIHVEWMGRLSVG